MTRLNEVQQLSHLLTLAAKGHAHDAQAFEEELAELNSKHAENLGKVTGANEFLTKALETARAELAAKSTEAELLRVDLVEAQAKLAEIEAPK